MCGSGRRKEKKERKEVSGVENTSARIIIGEAPNDANSVAH